MPTLAQLFINHPALKMEGFERLKSFFSAAAPLGTHTAVQLLNKFDNLKLTIQEGITASDSIKL